MYLHVNAVPDGVLVHRFLVLGIVEKFAVNRPRRTLYASTARVHKFSYIFFVHVHKMITGPAFYFTK
jgi:hypothetical protein